MVFMGGHDKGQRRPFANDKEAIVHKMLDTEIVSR